MQSEDLTSIDRGQLPQTDWDLVRRSQLGDQRSFHELVDRHARMLYGLAVSLVGNTADAEDVVQETLAGAYRGLRNFRAQASAKTWLAKILVRQAAMHYRSRKRRREDGSAQLESASPGEPASGRSDLRMDLKQAILALSPEHREVIVLRELSGMSYDEIADALELPRGTVESRLFRARRALQELLKDYLC